MTLLSPLSRAHFLFSLLFVAIINISLSKSTSYPLEVTRKFELFHDVGNGFIPRNSFIALTATHTGLENEPSYSLSIALDDSKASCPNDTCVKDDIEESNFQELMVNRKFYRIKAVDVQTGMEVLTSILPCDIRKANFREKINLVLSSKGDLISLDYKPLISPILASEACHTLFASKNRNKSFQFETSISYTTSEPAMTIPLILSNTNLAKNAITMLPNEKNRVHGGASGSSSQGENDLFPGENQQEIPKSFLMRYWYIFVPMFLISLFGGQSPEEEKEGESSSSQGAAVAATATAAGSASTVSAGSSNNRGSVKQRRGKRN